MAGRVKALDGCSRAFMSSTNVQKLTRVMPVTYTKSFADIFSGAKNGLTLSSLRSLFGQLKHYHYKVAGYKTRLENILYYFAFTSEGRSLPLDLGCNGCRSQDWQALPGLPLARQEMSGDSSERRWPHCQTHSLPPSASWRTAQCKEGRHGQVSGHSCPPASDMHGL